MTAPSASTCSPWAEMGDVCSPCDDYSFDPTLLADSLQIASDVLYELTGRRWSGECEETIRPCGYRTSDSGWCGCTSSRGCGCRRLSELRLPGYPASAVTEVKIDGVVIDPARYRVDAHRWLVYLPESDTAERRGWPCCQRLDLPDTEEDTFSVTYTFGQDPPPGGIKAAAILGCQIALACQPETAGGGRCRLPKRVTTITRQGVSMAVLDPMTFVADGLTGLTEVDLWVQSTLIGASRRRASVFRPDTAGRAARRP